MRWALALTVGISTGLLAQQPPPRGDGSVLVTVIADGSGRPVKGANVLAIVMTPAATFSRSVLTDRNGQALILGLPEGRVRVSASHSGFVGSVFGQTSPDVNGTDLTVRAGQGLHKITVRLQRGGAIAGVITDETGEPVVGIAVSSFRREYANGRIQFTSHGSATTDDRGMYRISGLAAGTYVVGITPVFAEQPIDETREVPTFVVGDDREVVMAPQSPSPSIDGGRAFGFSRTFYPGVSTIASATQITIESAEARDGINFRLESVRVTRVTGQLVAPPGVIINEAHLTLVPAGDDPVNGAPMSVAETASDGRFGFSFVPFGRYTIVVRASAHNRPDGSDVRVLWASQPIAVNDEANGVGILLNEGMTFSGRVRLVGLQQNTSAAWRVSLASQDATTEFRSYAGNLDNDGEFVISGVPPGRYSVAVTGVPTSGPYIASVMVGDRDALDFGLLMEPGRDVTNAVVILRDSLAEVTGTLYDSSGATTTAGSLVLFPSDERYWTGESRRVLVQRPDVSGHFQFRLLASGDYLIAAADVVRGQAQDPAFLLALRSRAVGFTLSDGEQKALDIHR